MTRPDFAGESSDFDGPLYISPETVYALAYDGETGLLYRRYAIGPDTMKCSDVKRACLSFYKELYKLNRHVIVCAEYDGEESSWYFAAEE